MKRRVGHVIFLNRTCVILSITTIHTSSLSECNIRSAKEPGAGRRNVYSVRFARRNGVVMTMVVVVVVVLRGRPVCVRRENERNKQIILREPNDSIVACGPGVTEWQVVEKGYCIILLLENNVNADVCFHRRRALSRTERRGAGKDVGLPRTWFHVNKISDNALYSIDFFFIFNVPGLP